MSEYSRDQDATLPSVESLRMMAQLHDYLNRISGLVSVAEGNTLNIRTVECFEALGIARLLPRRATRGKVVDVEPQG